VAALLDELALPAIGEQGSRSRSAPSLRRTLERWLRRGESIPGFGQRLYPGGDPRWTSLVEAMGEVWGKRPAFLRVLEVASRGQEIVGEPPNVDLALGSLARLLGMPAGGAWAMFALGRTAGWIAHAIEEYERGALIRPRAGYVGAAPRQAPEG
jgi:citrate synthase